MLPAQNYERAVASRCSATSSGKSLYSITCSRPSIIAKFAEPVLRRLLGDGHRRELRLRQQVVADEFRVADRRERIVDLQIEQVLDAAPPHVARSRRSRPAPRPCRRGHRGSGTANPFRRAAACRSPRRRPASCPGRTARHRPPAGRIARARPETRPARRASPGSSSCRSAPARRIAAPPRAPSRNGSAAATRPTPARSEYSPFGMIEPEPAPLPSRDEQHADLPGRERFRAARSRVGRRESTAARAIGQPHRRRRRRPARQRRPIVRRRRLVDTAPQSARSRSPRSAAPAAAAPPASSSSQNRSRCSWPSGFELGRPSHHVLA